MCNEHEKIIRSEVAKNDAETYGNKLYHYTSFSVLYNIIINKELWLGNSAMMNDKSEITDFVWALRNAALRDYPEKEQEILQLFEDMTKGINREYSYVMCFSKLSDNAAQWERYADDAKGVCIAFNTDKLNQLFFKNCGYLSEVFYEYDVRNHKHYELLQEYLYSGKCEGVKSKENWFNNILRTAAKYKHNSFISESECRMIVFPEINLIYPNNQIYSVKYKSIRDQIKKVLIVDLDVLSQEEEIDLEDVFEGITIGPRSTQNAEILREFCVDCGFNKLAEKISFSECPLR